MPYDMIVRASQSEEVSLDHLAGRAGMHPAFLERLVECGLIRPVTSLEANLLFESSTIFRLRSISRLRSELGINLQGVAAVLDLLERLQKLEHEIASLRAKL